MSLRASQSNPWMKAWAFSKGSRLLFDVGSGCGRTLSKSSRHWRGRSQAQKVAAPAWDDNRWSVNPMAMDFPSALNRNFEATGW